MRLQLLLFFLLFIPFICFSQSQRKLKRTFVDAEYHLLYEEYEDALPLFEELYESGKKTANINYRLGQCYLHIEGEKEKAVSYLEEAADNTTGEYDVGHFDEDKAPEKVFYYLGVAYRTNNHIDKAIKTFKTYKDKVQDDQEELKLVDAEIEACSTALELKERPTNMFEKNMGKRINSSNAELYPVVSGDQTKMVFVRKLKFYDAIFFSKKVDGKWSSAKNVSLEFESPRPLRPVHLSYDGETLYLIRNDNNEYNIYISKFSKNRWSPVEPLSDKINSDAYEMYASTTKDGNILYFTSNRDGGYGGSDIYKSVKDENGEWSEPENLGSTINTPFDEAAPFITENREKLFFSSKGHNNMGGYDIFYSEKKNNNWSKPVNMGYPINTTDDDKFFFPVKNGKIAYFPKIKPDNYGKTDVYKLELYKRENIPEQEEELDVSGDKN
ncbi:MAG: tetratricopeptide repeat protein [Bacteroidota bacterium]